MVPLGKIKGNLTVLYIIVLKWDNTLSQTKREAESRLPLGNFHVSHYSIGVVVFTVSGVYQGFLYHHLIKIVKIWTF